MDLKQELSMYDDDHILGLTQIEWDREQRQQLRVGFAFLGFVIAFIVGITIWFFS
jgi:hypothetical protein